VVLVTWPALLVRAGAGIPDTSGLACRRLVRPDGVVYVERFELASTQELTLAVHRWLDSEDQSAPHDHPWANCSTVLAGRLVEHGLDGSIELGPGDVVTRPAELPHRIELAEGPAVTLFCHGPILRRWGFHTPSGWVHWSAWAHAGHYADEAPTSRAWA
jgi:quercetin dioxygenase-like cupin family protein